LRIAVADTSALYAAIDASDRHHVACVAALSRPDLRIIIPAMAVTEVCQLLEHRIGAAAEASFLAALQDEDVRAPRVDDWPRIAQLIRQYSDFPLGGVDASVIALAEMLDTETVITLDQRHFGAVRPAHAPAFQLLPV
jgi:predicted nucleic acid-binding protein